MKHGYHKNPEVPLGLGMALSQNLQAMETFAGLSCDEQHDVVARAHSIRSKDEMQQLVNNLSVQESKF